MCPIFRTEVKMKKYCSLLSFILQCLCRQHRGGEISWRFVQFCRWNSLLHANTRFKYGISMVDFYWHVDLWRGHYKVAGVHRKWKILCINIRARKKPNLSAYLIREQKQYCVTYLTNRYQPTGLAKSGVIRIGAAFRIYIEFLKVERHIWRIEDFLVDSTHSKRSLYWFDNLCPVKSHSNCMPEMDAVIFYYQS